MPARPGKPRPKEKPEQIASELRDLIVAGQLAEGDSLGHESELIEQFSVSRPSLREALRILETEGLISVVRGVRGGVVVHEPNERMTARTAALVLSARNVALADVYEARALMEPLAVRTIAESARRRSSTSELRALVDEQEAAMADPESFGVVNGRFHQRLVALAGNQTMSIMAEMLNEIVARAVTDASHAPGEESMAVRRRGIRSQRRLVELIEAGDGAAAEDHWRSHMAVVGKVLLGSRATTVIDLLDHY